MVMKRSRICTEPELQTDLVVPVDAVPPPQDASKYGEGIVGPQLNFGEFLKTCYYCKKLIAEDEKVFIYRELCCTAVKSLFLNEGKHGGEATVESVQMIADLVKAHNCQLHPDSTELASAKASGESGGIKVLIDLMNGLEELAFAVELRLKIDHNHADLKGGSFREYGEAVIKHLKNIAGSNPTLQKAPVNYEGVRISGFGGWFLLRLSLHDPVLPLNIEASSKEGAVNLGNAVLSAVKEFPAFDTTALDKFVQA